MAESQLPTFQQHLRQGKFIKKQLLLIISLICTPIPRKGIMHSVRRKTRNTGWWDLAWSTYDDKRFKETFRVTRPTFMYILNNIHVLLEKETLTEAPISTEFRLATCLYLLGRVDYMYTISEMTGFGVSTVCSVVVDVSEPIIKELWTPTVGKHFPSSKEDFVSGMRDFEQLWQICYAFAAIDGCHIPIKCPPGGRESNKEYHNFKEFFSIVLMAMVDAKGRFIWANCGIPGNTHDSLIFQSTNMYARIVNGKVIPDFDFVEDGVKMNPLILGDSAFEFRPWIMKPYTNSTLNKEQRNFNNRLSRARMVIECAFGQLKGRWRILLRKCESKTYTVKNMTLAAIVLHNLCIELRPKVGI